MAKRNRSSRRPQDWKRGQVHIATFGGGDGLRRISTVSNAGTTGVPTVVLTAAYNAASSRTQLKATIASTLDFQNDYTFDNLQRQTRVEQVGQSGGNTVASKRLNYAYNAASFVTSVERQYKPSGTWTEVATSAFTFDDLDRLTGIDHKKSGTSLFTPYAYTYDRIDRITGITSQDGTVTYAYDPTSQLTSADYSYQTDQSFSFDANGNWNMSGYSTGTNNQMTSDGVYNYEYDDEGNLTKRTKISDGSYTEYAWDHRQRLTSLTNRNSSHTILSSVTYTYEAFNRRVQKSFDADGSGGGAAVPTNFVYDVSGTSVLLEFGGTSNLLRRNLWAEPLDQLFAVETAANATTWGLSDISRTVRDIIDNVAAVQNHLKFDANANVTSETASAVDYLMGFGGMVRDEETGLSYAWHRYQQNGHWLNEDPILFLAGDSNLQRVTGNDQVNKIDPTGLISQRELERLMELLNHDSFRVRDDAARELGVAITTLRDIEMLEDLRRNTSLTLDQRGVIERIRDLTMTRLSRTTGETTIFVPVPLGIPALDRPVVERQAVLLQGQIGATARPITSESLGITPLGTRLQEEFRSQLIADLTAFHRAAIEGQEVAVSFTIEYDVRARGHEVTVTLTPAPTETIAYDSTMYHYLIEERR